MTTPSQTQEENEISLIDILLFLKASTRNVLLSTATCLLLGAAYYFSVPNMYEATATIQVASVAGELVETPAVLLEKVKLPLFFSPVTMQVCGAEGDLSSQSKFADRLKPTLNKSAPFISLAAQARSTKEAQACLDTVIGEIRKSQHELALPLIEQKKQKLALLGDQLKLAEDMAKTAPAVKATGNVPGSQFLSRVLEMNLNAESNFELSNLRKQINTIENELLPPQTLATSLAVPMYGPSVSVNKRPLFTVGISLAFGVFLGLLITGVMRVLPRIRMQMREAEMQ